MANYNYDESGSMAAYFVLTFLSIFLVPYTLASFAATSSCSLNILPLPGLNIFSSRNTPALGLSMSAVSCAEGSHSEAGTWLSSLT